MYAPLQFDELFFLDYGPACFAGAWLQNNVVPNQAGKFGENPTRTRHCMLTWG